jgi:ABC-type cobalt transport system, permease component CbiQ and related transporters
MDILRSLPIGLYMEQPLTWLHSLDPRVKLFWLLSLLLSPIQATPQWRIGLVVFLILVTLLAGIPARAWRQQMGWLLLLAGMTLLLGLLLPDGSNVSYQPRRPLPEVAIPQPTDYRYVLFHSGFINITRRSLDLGLRVSSLIFTYLYAPTLFLLVTAPEEIVLALTSLALPLRKLGVPVVEILLTLTLALRFVPLVLEEIQNLVRAIRTRAINWKRLGMRQAGHIWLLVLERLVKNLFLRAEQTADAMQARGFTDPNTHLVKWRSLKLIGQDYLAIFGLGVWLTARIVLGRA